MADIHAQIRRAAKEAGVPERLFESLILHGERSYQGWQRSPAGAFGPAQLMPGTASYLSRKYGVNVNTYYGNLLGGAYYLKEQLQAFGGNPRKAVAAYNAGPGTVRSGSLPSETRNYISNVFGNLRGSGKVAMPIGPKDRSFVPAGMESVPGQPSFSLRSPPPVDILSSLTQGIGQIAQGFDPTEALKLTVPTLLESWLRPSTLVQSKPPPSYAPTPDIAPDMVPGQQPRAPRLHGAVTPINGKLIGMPYQGTHAKAFNVSGGSDNWESENAVDIAAPVGTPIRAVADGVIGPQFGPMGSGRFAGIRVHLRTKGNEYYYAHLSKTAPGIQPGVRVRRGQVIGYSGEANGVGHLHFASERGNPVGMVKRR